jgi:ethanolamine ammonia-lyase large subunit
VRRLLGKRPTPEFDAWCEEKGITKDGAPGPRFGDAAVVA